MPSLCNICLQPLVKQLLLRCGLPANSEDKALLRRINRTRGTIARIKLELTNKELSSGRMMIWSCPLHGTGAELRPKFATMLKERDKGSDVSERFTRVISDAAAGSQILAIRSFGWNWDPKTMMTESIWGEMDDFIQGAKVAAKYFLPGHESLDFFFPDTFDKFKPFMYNIPKPTTRPGLILVTLIIWK